MINGSPQYRTAEAFRRALHAHVKAEHDRTGRLSEHLNREFAYQRFLALVFAAAPENWVLKGGGSLMFRRPGARFTRDLDLLNLDPVTANEAVAELRDLVRPQPGDHLTYVFNRVETQQDRDQASIRVIASIGTTEFTRFDIDLVLNRPLRSAPDRVHPEPVIDMPGLPAMPVVLLHPVPDQLADKVCAMYEPHHGGHASSRYRDLHDLALIIDTESLDAARVLAALTHERKRRSLELPAAVTSPGLAWAKGYAKVVDGTSLPDHLRTLDGALTAVGACMDPLLSGTRTTGTWEPRQGWRT
ncbi:nucleotidyl transferase AbiEii/AbiGii toxin family protein [Luteipulveratus mongoliensis]|uniref:Nucleotidyl transferase AbiEii/AbiGii toxin family protein n=1 Tax=Luteipulveratus mongoliensis TaxID=571913 RepID=A0A0K1JDW9_9MICO|nr:nucleotidyl transferase AbiEii/AbiGii toxin family protein [Luteipulveratus mongoliensis]AKU14780.1 hypothetical protein VV02_00965 [Luteipulveratus mongoliensis]